MREQKTKAQVKKTNYDIIPNTHALYLYPHPDMNQPPTTTYAIPPPPPPTIIYNNNTMETEFLVQITQSNTFGSVRYDEIFNLNLRAGAGP